MADLGPPPSTTTTAVAVGFDRAELTADFDSVRLAARIDNHVDLDNDEQDAPVWIVSAPKRSWSAIWADLRVLG
jgi:hypothetical protein